MALTDSTGPHSSNGHGPLVLAVTGATGFVGSHLVARAVARGARVRALVRDQDRARATLPREGVTLVLGDIFDRGALSSLLEGATASAHLIGIRRESGGATFRRMHVDATRVMLEAAEHAGVRRYLHMSALGVRPNAASEYGRTKHEAETLVRTSGLDWTIFRPSLIHGAGGEFLEMAKGWATGKAVPHLFMPYFKRMAPGGLLPRYETPSVQPVFVEDVADAFLAAAARPGTIGEVYPLGGASPMTWPEMLETIRDEVPGGVPSMQAFGIPGDIAAKKAMVAERLGLGGLLPFGESDAIMGSEDNVCSTAKARADLGVDPAPFRESLATYAASL